MNALPMTDLHQTAAPWRWQLADSQAATLVPQTAPRWLHVDDGCVWVTAQDAGPHAPDLWLGAGDSLELPAGSTWVLQAWPQAQMSVLVPPALKQARQVSASSVSAVSKPLRQPTRAWWQSSWFWPWVLPVAQGRRRAVLSP